MTPEVSSLISACEWGVSNFFVVSSNVFVPLIYYSHLGAAIPTFIISLFIFLNGKKELPNILLLLASTCFSLWVISDLVLWATEFPEYTMFFWTAEIILEPLVYFLLFYFFFVYVKKRDFSLFEKVLFSLPLVPTLLLASTNLGLLGYDLSNCDRNAYEGVLTTYGYGIEIVYALLIVGIAIFASLQQQQKARRLEVLLLAAGTTLFLLSFSLGNIVEVFSENWYVGQFGLFGAPVFTALLAYLIVKYQSFNSKMIAAQALIVALWFLVLALLFIRTVENVRIVVSITLIFVLFIGMILIRSVKREIAQRENIEKLAHELENVNKQQVILIHFVTHQIKGFVAKSRNIFSLILDGDYGPVPEKMKPMIEEGFRSDTKGAQTIQEILNAANIKSGKVVYTMAEFDLRALIEEVAKDLQAAAEAKGLTLTLDLGTQPLLMKGDRGQLVNAFKNLIDNSIKYTPSGSVTVTLGKAKDGHIMFSVRDTGVGITKEDMDHLFTEGGRGKNSQRINVESTGFGLYIVRSIIEAHKGTVRADSAGEGKGSTFTVELPVN